MTFELGESSRLLAPAVACALDRFGLQTNQPTAGQLGDTSFWGGQRENHQAQTAGLPQQRLRWREINTALCSSQLSWKHSAWQTSRKWRLLGVGGGGLFVCLSYFVFSFSRFEDLFCFKISTRGDRRGTPTRSFGCLRNCSVF